MDLSIDLQANELAPTENAVKQFNGVMMKTI